MAGIPWAENPFETCRRGWRQGHVINHPEEASDAVMEVLLESKATSPGDNKNFLIEVNIENTRHNEIQLIGNGSWCIELGGRDCSLQMHEQNFGSFSNPRNAGRSNASVPCFGKTQEANFI